MKWYRITPLVQQGETDKEIWIREENGIKEQFNIDLYLGKKTDLLTLKKNIVETITKQVKYYRESRTEIYNQSEMEDVRTCPVCGYSSEYAENIINIYGAQYVQCSNCSHIYVKRRPLKKAIYNFYLSNATYATTYTDKKSAEFRLNAISVPWAKWMMEVFEKVHGRNPQKVLDVGSGAGHFVEACRRLELESNGIELNESSRKFSEDIWGIELDGRDFVEVANEYAGYDVVTFWGLLEHTTNPCELLEAAYDVVSKSSNGMVISHLPRWNSLSSAIQTLSTDSVIRHLEPMGHIMVFTDASAAEIYVKNRFAPVAAWYYGMDIYETLMQIGNRIGHYEPLTETRKLQVELQQYIDEIRFSDGLVLVGVPIK